MILDVGAGTGWIASEIASLCDEVYALEPNEHRVEFIKRKHPEVKAFVGTAESIVFPEGYFTKVFSIMAFHHFENHDVALEEFHRVLKGKGRLLILEADPESSGKSQQNFEKRMLKMNVKFVRPDALKEKSESHNFSLKEIQTMPRGYLLVAEKTG